MRFLLTLSLLSLVSCTYFLKPKYFYGDKVRFVSGPHSGEVGQIESSFCLFPPITYCVVDQVDGEDHEPNYYGCKTAAEDELERNSD
jgi:hypothetical protein